MSNNSFIKPNKTLTSKRKRRFLFRPIFFIPFGIFVALGLVSILFTIVFGLDRKYFGSSIDGYIKDENGSPVSNAQISLQDKKVVSNDLGYFSIEELKYGLSDIRIEKNGYSTLKKEIKLERLSNHSDFVLSPLEYGEINFQLMFTNPVFYNNEFQITLNNTQLPLTKDYKVSTGKVLVGKYHFIMTSPYYEDIEKDIAINSGIKEEQIYLIEKADIRAEFVDFLTTQPVEPDRIQIKVKDVYVDIDEKFLSSDKLELKDLEPGSETILKVTKKNYNDLDRTVSLITGINSLGQVALVPDGSIILISNVGGNTSVKSADYNGANATEITLKTGDCSLYKSDAERSIISCPGEIFSVSNKGKNSAIQSTYRLPSAKKFASPAFDKVIAVKASGKGIIDLVNDITIFEGMETITSVSVVHDSTYFTTSSGIYRTIQGDSTKADKVTEGEFIIADVYGSELLLQNYFDQKNSNIWILNTENGQKSKKSFLPGEYNSVQYGSKGEIYYLKLVGSDFTLFKGFDTSPLLEHIQKAIIIKNSNLMLIMKSTGLFLYNMNAGILAPII